jgi:protein-tyrosine phosphatase
VPHIVIVCTANLCRSPMAEHLLRDRLKARRVDWTISSVGTHARPGTSLDPNARAVLRRRGAPAARNWASRLMTAKVLQSADLVLTVTHAHLSWVMSIAPATSRRAFVLGQFATLLDNADGAASTPQDLIELATAARALIQPYDPAADDLADPIGGDERVFEQCADRIEVMLASVTRLITPGTDDLASSDAPVSLRRQPRRNSRR